MLCRYSTVTAGSSPYFFVQAPNGVGSNYLNMNITNSTDNKVSVNLAFSTGNIPIVAWSGSNPSISVLTDQHSYTQSWPFCELCKILNSGSAITVQHALNE